MNINPNLRNPLALFALCFLVVESVMTSILLYKVDEINLCPWVVKMLFVFIIAFPLILFTGFYILLWCKHEVLFSPYENALAEHIRKMGKKEIEENQKAKDAQYGVSMQAYEDTKKLKKSQTSVSFFSEEEILNQYIAKYASFMQKNIKVETKNGIRYFDAYAYWNGCHYVAEVKRLYKWTPSSAQGVRIFSTNARGCFSFLHMTLILCIADSPNKTEISQEIHKIDPTINVIFVSIDSNEIKFSEIY